MLIPVSFLFRGNDKINACYLSLSSLYNTFTSRPDKELMFQLDMPKRTWIRMKKALAAEGLIEFNADGMHIRPLCHESEMLMVSNTCIML
jgi:hypothetical protein